MMQRHRILGFMTCLVYTYSVREAGRVVITGVGEMMLPRLGETVNAGNGDHLPCFTFEELGDEARLEVEEDYQICVRRSQRSRNRVP
jgi:hypothetical protein